jgi:hypothetical protein
MSKQRNTAENFALSSEAYELIVDTIASATRSRLNYWNSVCQIAYRPYASMAIGSTVRENFDRASEFANLTLAELNSRVQTTADFSEKFLAQFGKLQDAARETYRDSLTSYASTVDQVKDTSTEMPVNGVSIVDQVKDASMEMSVNGASTVDQVEDVSTEMSVNGKRRKTHADLVSVT